MISEIEKSLAHYQGTLTQNPETWIPIKTALQEALLAGKAKNYSVGTVIANSKGVCLSKGRNEVFHPRFQSHAHAEMQAITEYEKTTEQTSDVILYTTLEPCLMCTARIVLSGIQTVVYLKKDPASGGSDFIKSFPPEFKKLATRVTFREFKGDPGLQAISDRLYEWGEKIWAERYDI